MDRERFHYRSLTILPWYFAMTGMAIFLIIYPTPTTYFAFLKTFPGSLVRYGIAAALGYFLLRHIPTFIGAALRIPAVEFDGRTLLVRGWADRSFLLEGGRSIEVQVDDLNGHVSISAPGVKQARIALGTIEAPTSLTRFLRDLALQGGSEPGRSE